MPIQHGFYREPGAGTVWFWSYYSNKVGADANPNTNPYTNPDGDANHNPNTKGWNDPQKVVARDDRCATADPSGERCDEWDLIIDLISALCKSKDNKNKELPK